VTYAVRLPSQPFGADLGQKGVKVAAGEGPIEGRGGPLIMALKSKKALLEIG
jgi:hypothetical protein